MISQPTSLFSFFTLYFSHHLRLYCFLRLLLNPSPRPVTCRSYFYCHRLPQLFCLYLTSSSLFPLLFFFSFPYFSETLFHFFSFFYFTSISEHLASNTHINIYSSTHLCTHTNTEITKSTHNLFSVSPTRHEFV